MLERLEHLLEGQERCFDTFSRFASPAAQALWQALCASDTNINACRLRDIARRTSPARRSRRSWANSGSSCTPAASTP